MGFSIDAQMALYKQLMVRLTTEKERVTPEIKQKRQEKTYKVAKGLFSIAGDDKLNTKIDSYLTEISSVKPGRKLIKALAKTKQVIKVTQGWRFAQSRGAITVKDCEAEDFNMIDTHGKECGMKSPAWISFAHELIHALNFYTDAQKCNKYEYVTMDILYRMDSLEEQRAITGYDPFLFAQSNTLKPEDVLCENAFHVALGRLPRIDHLQAKQTVEINTRPQTYDFYYSWLENKLKTLKTIPEDKKTDLDFLIEFLKFYTNVSQVVYNSYDHDFLLKLYEQAWCKGEKLLLLCRELGKDAEFVLKAMDVDKRISRYCRALIFADEELLKSKAFVLKALDKIGYSSKEVSQSLLLSIDPSLRQDAEILQKLGLA